MSTFTLLLVAAVLFLVFRAARSAIANNGGNLVACVGQQLRRWFLK